MKLADDHIALKLGGEHIALRPTLRCGLRLERRPGSFAKLIEDLQGGSLTAALFVLTQDHDHPALGAHVLDAGLETVCAALIAFVMQCAGIEPDAKPDSNAANITVSFAEHLTNLYRIGTGWLGWTPAITLNSTPVEITEAYAGRVEMLKAIFGGESESKPATADQLRDAFRSLGAVQHKAAANA
jgi:hypothetical protein